MAVDEHDEEWVRSLMEQGTVGSVIEGMESPAWDYVLQMVVEEREVRRADGVRGALHNLRVCRKSRITPHFVMTTVMMVWTHDGCGLQYLCCSGIRAKSVVDTACTCCFVTTTKKSCQCCRQHTSLFALARRSAGPKPPQQRGGAATVESPAQEITGVAATEFVSRWLRSNLPITLPALNALTLIEGGCAQQHHRIGSRSGDGQEQRRVCGGRALADSVAEPSSVAVVSCSPEQGM